MKGQLVEGHFVPVPDGRLYNRWLTSPMNRRPSGTGTDGRMYITWLTIHKSHPPFDHLIYIYYIYIYIIYYYIIFDQLTQVPLCRKLVEMWEKPVDQVVYIRPNDTSII